MYTSVSGIYLHGYFYFPYLSFSKSKQFWKKIKMKKCRITSKDLKIENEIDLTVRKFLSEEFSQSKPLSSCMFSVFFPLKEGSFMTEPSNLDKMEILVV